MNRKNTKLIIILFISLLFSIRLFAKNNAGTNAGQFLNLGIGARAIAMGNAYIVNTNDASAVYWNPAGLGAIETPSILFMHGVWLEDISNDWLSYVHPIRKGSIGIAMQYVNYGDIQGYNNDGEKTKLFRPLDKMLSLSYGFSLTNLRLGATIKYIESEITKKTNAYTFDLGLQYKITEVITLGLAAKNYFGSKLKYKNISEPLPKSLEIGAGFSGIKNVLVEMNIKQFKNNKENINAGLGMEYKTNLNKNSNIALRAGYNTLTKDVAGLKGISTGFGYTMNRYTFDYAYKPIGELGDTHLVSFSVDF